MNPENSHNDILDAWPVKMVRAAAIGSTIVGGFVTGAAAVGRMLEIDKLDDVSFRPGITSFVLGAGTLLMHKMLQTYRGSSN